MKKLYLYILSLGLIVTACKSNQIPQQEDLVISLQKTRCFGACPVYTLKIYKNGTVIYNGEENVDLVGNYRAEISKDKLNGLINEFVENDFFQFKDEYDAHVTDLPTTYIYFAKEDKSKKIKDYYGAPESLKKLEQKVADLLEELDWSEME